MGALQKIRKVWMRVDRARYQRRAAQREDKLGVIEKLGALQLYVPQSVLSPTLFRTGPLLAKAAVSALPRPGASVLDMGSGSGVVGVTAAKAGARVTSIDRNPAAVRATAVNAWLNRADLRAIQGDLFSPLPSDARFDLIAFNPPFFTRAQGGALQMALTDGPGLPLFGRFLREAKTHLQPRGQILIAASTNGALELMRTLYREHGYTLEKGETQELISERLVIDRLRG